MADPEVGAKTTSGASGKRRGRRFSKRKCGQCGAPELYAASPEGWARWVPAFTGLVTVRCPACGWRRVRPSSWAEELAPTGGGSSRRSSRSRRRGPNRAAIRTQRRLLGTMFALAVAAFIGWRLGIR